MEDAAYDHIVQAMLESGYTLEELSSTFAYEVAPTVYTNLFNIFPGGVWGGFEHALLRGAVLKTLRSGI